MTLSAGSKLGVYEIVGPLGAGGMGEVYRARDARLSREVALKVLPEDFAADPGRRARFEQEARSASALNHPNILTIYDIGQADGVTWIAMELIEGRTLRELIAGGDPLPSRRLLDVASQAAEGLAKAHASGIVHRDLKPENVMVSKDGFVKILDFGLAKLAEPLAAAQDASALPTAVVAPTAPGTVMGTVGYMSPEQASGHPMDFRSDQFSLGAILYEMATGRRAFQRKTGAETLAAIIRDEPEPLSQAAPRAPAPIRWIVDRLLAKDPDERYASTRDLARDLKSLRDHLSEAVSPVSGAVAAGEPDRARRRRWALPALLGLVVGAALAWGALRLGSRPDPTARFQKLTFQRGSVGTARFAPDGQSLVFGAAWEGRPIELFSLRFDSNESRPLGLPEADLLAISRAGEMAVSLHKRYTLGFEATGTLARVPLSGGAPREVLEGVQDADWSPDGQELAVSRPAGTGYRLEFPIGKALYETAGWIDSVRVSPDGRYVAFADHPIRGDSVGGLRIVDRSGKTIVAIPPGDPVRSLAWSADGSEVWSAEGEIRATSLSGKRRIVFAAPSLPAIQDVARDGRAILTTSSFRREIVGAVEGKPERNLTWLDWSIPVDIASDGMMVFNEQAIRPQAVYMRDLSGSPAVRLSAGSACGFSRDAKWVIGRSDVAGHQLILLPTGAGQPVLGKPNLSSLQWAAFFPDSERLLVVGNEPGHGVRLYVQDRAGNTSRPISGEGVSVSFSQPISPDGRLVAAVGQEQRLTLYPVDGGAPRVVPGVEPGEVSARWTPDGRSLYVYRMAALPLRVDLVDVETGRRTPWRTFQPPDPAGVPGIGPIAVAPDGSAYAYSYRRQLAELSLATGLR